jgi:hypothetical protein
VLLLLVVVAVVAVMAVVTEEEDEQDEEDEEEKVDDGTFVKKDVADEEGCDDGNTAGGIVIGRVGSIVPKALAAVIDALISSRVLIKSAISLSRPVFF